MCKAYYDIEICHGCPDQLDEPSRNFSNLRSNEKEVNIKHEPCDSKKSKGHCYLRDSVLSTDVPNVRQLWICRQEKGRDIHDIHVCSKHKAKYLFKPSDEDGKRRILEKAKKRANKHSMVKVLEYEEGLGSVPYVTYLEVSLDDLRPLGFNKLSELEYDDPRKHWCQRQSEKQEESHRIEAMEARRGPRPPYTETK